MTSWRSLLGLLLAVLGTAQASRAGDLRDFVNDLYGGDGITLVSDPRNAPSGINPGFVNSSIEGLDSLSSELLSTLNLFSLSSAPPGFTFDFELGVPIKQSESLGPLIAERAETIGKGRLNVAFSYSHIDFKRIDGEKLSDLEITLASDDIIPPAGIGPDPPCDPMDPLACTSAAAVELDELKVDIDVEIQRDVFAIFGKYGILESWDVEAVVPIVRVEVKADAKARVERNVFNPGLSNLLNRFDPAEGSDFPTSRTRGSATGLGDVLLRTKYNFLRDHGTLPDMAVLAQVTLPTGDEDDLLGAGETAFRGTLIASRPFGSLTPHLNLGYEVTTGDAETQNLRYAAGFDVQVHPKLTLALDAVGVYGPKVDLIDNHLVDGAFGVRAKVWRDLLLNVNVQVPLNRDSGLRPDFIGSVGFDYTFGGD